MTEMGVPEWAGVFSAVFTMVAAGAAWASTCAAKRASEAALALQFLRDYSSHEMHRALETLGESRRHHTVSCEPVSEARARMEIARRPVAHYYENIWNLYNTKLMNKQTVGATAHLSGLDLIEAIDRILGIGENRWMYGRLRAIVGQSRQRQRETDPTREGS